MLILLADVILPDADVEIFLCKPNDASLLLFFFFNLFDYSMAGRILELYEVKKSNAAEYKAILLLAIAGFASYSI